jgi:PPOX class probable F420-dependent enzyme
MPKGPLPESHLDLLSSPILAHLATVDGSGRPQVNPVWFLWTDGRLLLSIKPETAKYRNLRNNPYAALSIVDPRDSFRYLELRGRVIDFELFTTFDFVNLLARKYTGHDFTAGRSGEERYRVTIEIETWTAQGH